MKFCLSFTAWSWFLGACVLTLAVCAHSYFFHLDVINALRGYSILEYLAQKQFPQNFMHDYGGGVGVTEASIITVSYQYLASLTGLDGQILQYLMIGVEIMCFVAGALFLWYVVGQRFGLSGESVHWGGFWLVLIITLTSLLKVNLANFSFPYFHGQFYGFADGLRLAAIAFALQRRWVFVAFCLMVGFMIHPIKTVMGGAFIGAIALYDWRRSVTFVSIGAGLCVAGFIAFWAVFWLGQGGGDDGSGVIPGDLFAAYARIFQVHWFPFDIGFFEENHQKGILAFLSLLLMVSVAAVKGGLPSFDQKQWLAGFAVLSILTVIGIWVSYDAQSASLIKLSLIRATTLMALLAPFLLLPALLRSIEDRQFHWSALFSVFMIGGFENAAYLSPLISIAGVILYQMEQRKTHWFLAGFAALLIIVTVGMNIAFVPDKDAFLLGAERLGFVVLAFGLFVLAVRLASALPLVKGLDPRQVVILSISFVFVLCASVWSYQARMPDQDRLAKAAAYQDVQIWARGSTRNQDVFMVDPCLYYGWRDFSHRASLGTPREWYLTGWGYSGNVDNFNQGLEIGRLLGLTMDAYLPSRGERLQYTTTDLCVIAQDLFYADDHKGIRALAQAFRLDYLVTQQSELSIRTGWQDKTPPVFKNDFFSVYSVEELLK